MSFSEICDRSKEGHGAEAVKISPHFLMTFNEIGKTCTQTCRKLGERESSAARHQADSEQA